MTTKFKKKDLRRDYKDGLVKHYWKEIYRSRSKRTLASDLRQDRFSELMLQIAVTLAIVLFVAMCISTWLEVAFAIVIFGVGVMSVCLFAWFLTAGAGDRLTKFVDDICTIAEWGDVETAVILAIPEPDMLSLATGIISKAAAELILYESTRPAPRNRMWSWYEEHRRLAVAFNTRFVLFGKLMLLSVSDWSVNLDAGRYLIEAGEFPSRSSPAA